MVNFQLANPQDRRPACRARLQSANQLQGNSKVKTSTIALALCCALVSVPASAKTFVGVLWPMFGPLPAIGLVELVAELKMMPDVEVNTYLHQSWPSLVDDIDRQPKGTRIAVIGYSLGANSSVFVANKAKYVDLIIALQPSMLSWDPPVTGQVGRMIEIYNPNPWMTFGGMGSRKLEGPNIEYVANNDSHPGAQFSSQFRSLVKSEIAKLATENRLEVAKAEIPRLPTPARAPKVLVAVKDEQPRRDEEPRQEQPTQQREDVMAFLDTLSNAVNSGDLSMARHLTVADLMDYAKRRYDYAKRSYQVSQLSN